jgi:hypothetical protein
MVKPKQIFLVLLVAFCLGSVNAQKSKEIKMKLADFKKAYRLHDVIKDIPGDCKVESYELSVVVMGNEKVLSIDGDILSEDVRTIATKVGQKIFFENISSNCKSKHKPKYTVVLD